MKKSKVYFTKNNSSLCLLTIILPKNIFLSYFLIALPEIISLVIYIIIYKKGGWMNNINKDSNLFTNKIKCFIFDFDDTLYYGVDWTEWNDMQQKWIRSHYQDLTDEQFSSLCLQATGKTNLEGKDIVQLLIKEEGSAKAYLDWRNSIDGEMSEFEKNGQVVSMDEIRKFRSQCDRLGGKMFIVSNSTQKGIEVFAKHYKIDLSLFDGIYVNQYSAEDATKKKIYQQIMNDNNLSNDQIMVIGNSYKQDLAPAKELKLCTFLCKDGFTYDEVVEN